MSARRVALVAAALTVLPLLGCSQLPVDGPIVETRSTPDVDEVQPLGYDPLPPEPGASKIEVVNGFLDAMTAWPQRLDVAKQFLSQQAQGSWKPQESTLTYQEVGVVEDPVDAATVHADLIDAERFDARGSWQGPVPASESGLQLRTVREDGEFRIVDPPDAQVVPSDWFGDRYRQANVYFFDNTSRILVPEPVFVPRGTKAATTLVSRLLEGPADPRVETTAFPEGLSLDFSAPVSDDGVADIRLVGSPPPESQEAIERMLAQLAWTLRQEEVTALRLNISGQEISLPGGVSEFDIDSSPEYNPTGYQADFALYGLRDGVLVAGNREELQPVTGPFGVRPHPFRSVAVSIDGTNAAAVSENGSRVLVAAVRDTTTGEPSSGIVPVVEGATDLLTPAWDFAGRLWVVDRTSGGSVVSYVDGGVMHELDVPGVSRRNVTSFLVSRDATRFVAVVRTRVPGSPTIVDELRVGRIQVSEDGGELRVRSTEEIALGGTDPLQVKAIAWTSTTTIAALRTVTPGSIYSVQTVAVDGAPTDTSPTTFTGDVTGLAGTPVPDSRQYAVTPTSLIDIPTRDRTFLDAPNYTSLGYVG
jgi:hypothetical protein